MLVVILMLCSCNANSTIEKSYNELRIEYDEIADELQLEKERNIEIEEKYNELVKTNEEQNEYVEQLKEALDYANEQMGIAGDFIEHKNPFNADEIKLLDRVNDMILVDKLEYISDDYHSVKGLEFYGTMTVSGEYFHQEDSEYSRECISFVPDEESAILFPKVIGDERNIWMTFGEYDEISDLFGEQGEYGYVELIIDYYYIDLEATETSNVANIVKVLNKECEGINN